jgi:hypothetical protein
MNLSRDRNLAVKTSRLKKNAHIVIINKIPYIGLSNSLQIDPIIAKIFKSKVVRLATNVTLMKVALFSVVLLLSFSSLIDKNLKTPPKSVFNVCSSFILFNKNKLEWFVSILPHYLYAFFIVLMSRFNYTIECVNPRCFCINP